MGSPLGDDATNCPSNEPLQWSSDEKRYRLSRAIGYNFFNQNGVDKNFGAFRVIFSAIDPGLGLPDKEYMFGSDIGAVS